MKRKKTAPGNGPKWHLLILGSCSVLLLCSGLYLKYKDGQSYLRHQSETVFRSALLETLDLRSARPRTSSLLNSSSSHYDPDKTYYYHTERVYNSQTGKYEYEVGVYDSDSGDGVYSESYDYIESLISGQCISSGSGSN